MHLDFLYDYFSAYEMKLCNELKVECLYIRNLDYTEPIKIYYELDDYKTYTLWFATQHLHITTKDELIETISNFANGSIAAIEFYDNGKNCFGGQIDTERLSDITYHSLREYFGYPNDDISHLTFRVYAWNKNFCYEGSFIKRFENEIDIIKKY